MKDTITQTTALRPTTERVTLFAEITPEDEEKLTTIAAGSALPRGTALANMVYLQTIKFRENERKGLPLPADITPPLQNA